MKSIARLLFRIMLQGTLLLSLAGCVSQPLRLESLSHPGSLDFWLEWELIPYLKTQLAEHPRLRNQPIRVVRTQDGMIQARIDGLSRDLRRRITDALVRTRGIQLSRGVAEPRHHRRLAGADCSDPLDKGVFISIESTARMDGRRHISVRILNAEENSWVSGFGMDWLGQLNPDQLRAETRSSEDELLRGLRILPFRGNQPDLAAGYFANNFSCLLRQRGLSESRIHVQQPAKSPASLATLIGLVDNYLSRLHQVQIVDQADKAHYLLESEAHALDGNLHQLWLRLRDKDKGIQVPGLDTSAYVRLDAGTPTAAPKPIAKRVRSTPRPKARKKPVPVKLPATRAEIQQLQLLRASRSLGCRTDAGLEAVAPHADLSANGCYQVSASAQGRLFLLFHQPRGGLLRINPDHCPGRALDLADGSGVGTLYALASSDNHQSASIDKLWRQLPSACAPYRIKSVDTNAWSASLQTLIDRKADSVAWSALRYRFHTQE